MSSEWPMVAIGEVADVFDGPHATPKTVDQGPIFLGIGALQNGRIQLGETRHVTPEDFKTWTRRVRPESGDVVFSYETRLGEAAIIPEGLECCLGRRMALVRADRVRLDPRYFLYQFLSPYFQELIRSQTIPGATVDRIALKDFPSFEIPLPPLKEQQAFAEVLGALDDRIDNLRATNATLEAIAQAIFKSWFIDFDPVRAKMEGREPEGMDAETAALFPSEFEESELGLIPRGWRVQPIGELTEIVGGSTPDTKNEDYWAPGVFHWTSPKDLSGATAPVLIDTERLVSEAGLTKISSGLLPPETLLLSSRAPIGYLSLSKIPVAINQGYIAMLPGGTLPTVYLYFWTQANMEVIKDRSNGSTFMEISKKMFRPIPALVPPLAVAGRFAGVAEGFFDRITANQRQAHHLSDLRDLLLPRLISGKISIGAAGAALEAA